MSGSEDSNSLVVDLKDSHLILQNQSVNIVDGASSCANNSISKLLIKEKVAGGDDGIDEAAMNILNGEDFTLEPTTIKTRSGRNKDHVKRPMNAFMVYAQVARKLISKSNSNLQNSEISKKLGELWRRTDEASKRVFIERAEILRQNHKKEHPDYKYQPRRKKSKANPHSRSPRSHSRSSSNSDQPVPIRAKSAKKAGNQNNSRINGTATDYKLMEKTISNTINDYDMNSPRETTIPLKSCNYNSSVLFNNSYSNYVDQYHFKSQCEQQINRYQSHIIQQPPCSSPCESIQSGNSDPSQPLTPPATPSSSILLTNKAAMSPHSLPYPVKSEPFKSSPAHTSPVPKNLYLNRGHLSDNSSSLSPNDPYHHSSRPTEFYRSYCQTSYPTYQHPNQYIVHPNSAINGGGIGFQSAAIIETDVDPKEMEQYLDGPGQSIKKVPTFNHYKTDENLLLELQSAGPHQQSHQNVSSVCEAQNMVIYPIEGGGGPTYQNAYSTANWDYSYPNL